MTSPLSVVLEEKLQGEIREDSDPTTDNKKEKLSAPNLLPIKFFMI